MVTIDNGQEETDSEVIEETPEESMEIDAAPDVVLGDADTEVNEGDEVSVDAGDTVVTVVTPDAPETPSDALIENAIDVESRLTRLETRMDALELAQVMEAVEEAAEESEEAEEDAEILDALEEEPEESDDSDEGFFESGPEPKSAKAHPLFRPFSEWRNK